MNASMTSTERAIKAKRALFDKYYSYLTDTQRRAAFTVNGPLLILAGAGSGKTTVLINRIAFILQYGDAYFSDTLPQGVSEEDIVSAAEQMISLDRSALAPALAPFAVNPCPPWAVLAITFTNKAAKEIKERLARAVGEEMAKEVWTGTFHSVCVRLLHRFGERVGCMPGFTIYDSDDTKKMLLKCMNELNIDEKTMPPKTVQNAISRAKDELKTPEEYEKEANGDFRRGQIAKIYKLYQKRLLESNALDFDDIIMRTVTLLEEDDDAREFCQRRFRYVMVDEYQDTNAAQFRLVRLLSGYYNNLMVVGDDDQSIYKFRGATIENILGFDRVLKNATVIKLEQNFRSTKTILDAANAVIKNNQGRRGKQLWTAGENGDKILYKRLENQNEEARFIVNHITQTVAKENKKFSDFAVLYRINAQSNGLESAFARSGIPYRILGGTRFFDRKEIKDVVAYLCVINNPGDNLRLRRIINEPKRKIGEATVNLVEEIAIAEGVSMFEVMSEANRYPALYKASAKLMAFVTMINQLRAVATEGRVAVLIDKTLDLTGYRNMLILGGEAEIDRLENVQELISTAKEYEMNHEDEGGNYDGSLSGFLEEAALVSDVDGYDTAQDAVVLMTVHSAKGLEFPTVFLPGFEENIFPGMQSAADPSELEEERRLAYVAITRAKKNLIITSVRERMLFGRTNFNPVSRFYAEIPEGLIQDESLISAPTQTRVASEGARAAANRSIAFGELAKKPTVGVTKTAAVTLEAFTPGQRVVHATFGGGMILSATKMGSDLLYEVAFDNVGTKKLMATYARLKKEE